MTIARTALLAAALASLAACGGHVTSVAHMRQPLPANVTISFQSCRKTADSRNVSVIRIPDGKVVAAGMLSVVAGHEMFTASVPAGLYSVVAGVLPCSGTTNLATLPGKGRAIALRGRDQLTLDDGGALAGIVRRPDVRIMAGCIGASGERMSYVAAVQDDAYYFDTIRAPVRCRILVTTAQAPKNIRTAFRVNISAFRVTRRDIAN